MACIRKRRVGKSYRWVLDYRDQQGRRHWETTKGNRKEAERLLAERVRDVSRGTYQAPTERVNFEDLAQAYLRQIKPNLRETTIRDYRGNLRLHLLPYLQGWKLRDIRRKQVEELRGKLLDAGVGPSTVNKALTLAGALFRYAIKHEYIEANPAEGTKLRASSRRSHLPRSKRSWGPLMHAGA